MISQRELFLRHVAPTSDMPLALEIERAEGVYLYDTKGRRYIDLISGISVSNLGHGHPKILEAVNSQMKKHAHLMVYGEYVQYPQVKLAEKLTSLLPEKLNCVYFTNSGTEATEGAMKLCKRASGRTQIISFRNSYHGSTQGALSIMGSEEFKTSFRPLLPDTLQLDYNSFESLVQITQKTAAVFVEVIQAESGIQKAKQEWLQHLRQKCDETGTLLVFDEIQTGFGRTGKLFAFEHYQVIPDVLLVGKAFGGGLPLGAFISSHQLMQELTYQPVLGHITTFGGNPVCCAAGLASLETLLEEGWMQSVDQKNKMLSQFNDFSSIEFRSFGLLAALNFTSSEFNMAAIRKVIAKGVITDWFLFNASAMRIAPPLIISDQELKEAVEIISETIHQLQNS